MAIILSLETSTSVCSVAIHEKGQLRALQEVNEPGAHAGKLMDLITACLENSVLQIENLDAIAVSSGPGSYTGLRIGISAAKGLAFARNVPIIGVSSMEVLAHAARHEMNERSLIIPLLDARRMEVYAEVFNDTLDSVSGVRPVILGEGVFENYLSQSVVCFIGDGVSKAKNIISHPNAKFSEASISARFMGEVAWKKFLIHDFEDLAYFAPDYLKEFKALKSTKNPLLK
ncbi:tRNA (adenosine(37)-N6)-threonylcarbamoyltransferase complex dimerization subunit type 1 TsaB [Algoriphagus namhaensis]|uniref:tRNA (Adenosine(37)-N6)-threonylcarbamoyltransferase complex dimerization subunit type 1 TsaB n=1 Tax=Algoriphagus namhaensis TaxID=915353 RepID=A0ABV8ARC5_9BACT